MKIYIDLEGVLTDEYNKQSGSREYVVHCNQVKLCKDLFLFYQKLSIYYGHAM